jgi:putative Ca2+/H+ antiporter (TMEM165/GDT1 family)
MTGEWTSTFGLSVFFVLIAEMGDKTQLVALAFATRYPTKTVISGVFWATLAVHLFSVALGEAAGLALPVFWIRLLAGLSFVFFGLWTLRGDELTEEETSRIKRFGPFMTVAVTFFLAELGDKTMLTTVTIASQHHNFVAVWIGSTLGMVIADGLAIMVGKVLGKRIPERLIKFGAAAIFILAGAYTVLDAFGLFNRQ